MNRKRDFIINDLMNECFIEYEGECICLEETEDSGKSILEMHFGSHENLCIKNVDKKNTLLYFLKNDKNLSLFKRVDHMVFEHVADKTWKLHLIEMKSSVGCDKWTEIKGKFRASYLLAQGLAAILEINIVDVCMYTSYENVHLEVPDTMPSGRRLFVGERQVRPMDEWQGVDFALNFGERIRFSHKPIQMQRNEKRVLVGQLTC